MHEIRLFSFLSSPTLGSLAETHQEAAKLYQQRNRVETFRGRDHHGQGQGWPHLSWAKKRKENVGIPEVWENNIHPLHLYTRAVSHTGLSPAVFSKTQSLRVLESDPLQSVFIKAALSWSPRSMGLKLPIYDTHRILAFFYHAISL